MTAELALGPCYVAEISGCGEDTPKSFRDCCGPADPVHCITIQTTIKYFTNV